MKLALGALAAFLGAWLIVNLVGAFIVGAIARAIFPGAQPMSLWATTGLGVLGSLVGGLLVNIAMGLPLFALQPAGLVGSVIGALLVMLVAGFSMRSARA